MGNKTKLGMVAAFAAMLYLGGCTGTVRETNETTDEPYRPAFHFTPQNGWMNDPNGMVFHKGKYHLFFQHNPDTTVWGPMHWGHATSTDLIHWEERPIGLYPDSLGTIFSGSAVVDEHNTAGFGAGALVAIFTHHNHAIEEAKTGQHQYQSLAYSTDDGETWTKYEGNPVLPNPGIWDFRDPKVMWHEATRNWVMTLATKQTITFYASPNLKEWTRLSEFGEGIGAHGGVWECPDLIPFDHDGRTLWVLLVSINPGGPNGGSATQYFVGDFDGKTFTPHETETKWLDYGRDNYAGITWSNTGDRRVFIGWMNNWDYANHIPTGRWRGAATVARDLSIRQLDGKWYVASTPVPELAANATLVHESPRLEAGTSLAGAFGDLPDTYRLDITASAERDFQILLKNDRGEQVTIGYLASSRAFFIDRSQSGNTAFHEKFASRDTAPRIAKDSAIALSLLVDKASVELFADGGLTVMTETFFPTSRLDDVVLSGPSEQTFNDVNIFRIH